MSVFSLTPEEYDGSLSAEQIKQLIHLGITEASKSALPSFRALMNLDAATISAEENRVVEALCYSYFQNQLNFVIARKFDAMVDTYTTSSKVLDLLEDVLNVRSLILPTDDTGMIVESDKTVLELPSLLRFYWRKERKTHMKLVDTDEEKARAVEQRRIFVNGRKFKARSDTLKIIKIQASQYGCVREVWTVVDAIVAVALRACQQATTMSEDEAEECDCDECGTGEDDHCKITEKGKAD